MSVTIPILIFFSGSAVAAGSPEPAGLLVIAAGDDRAHAQRQHGDQQQSQKLPVHGIHPP